jgi:endogenous inhibitor of DNA gyrase (YacG/DUF329 family)
MPPQVFPLQSVACPHCGAEYQTKIRASGERMKKTCGSRVCSKRSQHVAMGKFAKYGDGFYHPGERAKARRKA